MHFMVVEIGANLHQVKTYNQKQCCDNNVLNVTCHPCILSLTMFGINAISSGAFIIVN